MILKERNWTPKRTIWKMVVREKASEGIYSYKDYELTTTNNESYEDVCKLLVDGGCCVLADQPEACCDNDMCCDGDICKHGCTPYTGDLSELEVEEEEVEEEEVEEDNG